MSWKRGVLLAVLTLCLIPRYGLCNGIVQFSLGNFQIANPVAAIYSVTGSGGTGNSGMLTVTGGQMDLTGIGNWLSGGTLDVTAQGTVAGIASSPLMVASFSGGSLNWITGNLVLDGFSGSLNPGLASYYGVGGSLDGASINFFSGVLSVDPGGAVAATEAGGLPMTLGLVLMGGLVLLVGACSRFIRVVI